MVIIPEIKVNEILRTILKIVEVDFHESLDEKDSILYKIFGDNRVEKFGFFSQAKDIFLRDESHPRKIETRLLFDAQRASLPTIHTTMPSESPGADGIGIDEGYNENIVDKDSKQLTKVYNRSFETRYHLMITSDNSLEVILIYHLMKNMLISIFDHIEFEGIRNMKLSGMDLQINSDMVPSNIFVRGVEISFFYESQVPSFQRETLLKKIQLNYQVSQ